VKKLIAVVAAFAAMLLLVSTVSATYGDLPSESSFPSVSTFAGEVYRGEVCDISYRLVFSDDGNTFEVRTEKGIDKASGTVKEVWGRVDGEVIGNRIELDSYSDTNDVYQWMIGNFDDATGQSGTLTLYFWDFRPGHESCVGEELTISRK
jgi:hypothetical protein